MQVALSSAWHKTLKIYKREDEMIEAIAQALGIAFRGTNIPARLKLSSMLMLFIMSASCIGPLDTLGNETITKDSEQNLKEDNLEDDKIEDKNPIYDPDLSTVETFGHCKVTMNKSNTVTALDIVPFSEENEALEQKLFAGRRAAMSTLGGNSDARLIPSMEVINGTMKPFNDGMYAAVELGIEDGQDGIAVSKRQFLKDLLSALLAERDNSVEPRLTHFSNAAVMVAAALMVSGADVQVPGEIEAQAQSLVDKFVDERSLSRPVGFYTWSQDLQNIFKQDRLLQNQLLPTGMGEVEDFGRFAAIAVVLSSNEELRESYEQILALYAGLTNPYASYSPMDIIPYVTAGASSLDDVASVKDSFDGEHPDLLTCTKASYALLPSSRSKDTEFYNSHWCDSGLPGGVNFIDEFISAIKSGEVDLAPGDESGWYDYQLWALETLLLPERGPESDHLLLSAAYKKKLIDTFKSIITQNRETHVKQLQGGAMGSDASVVEIEIYPLLPVEPFPTFYLRSARGYRFVSLFLQGLLGDEFLSGAHRLTEDMSSSDEALQDEFAEITKRLYGFYFLSADALGLRAEDYLKDGEMDEFSRDECVTSARAWLESWQEDPDVLRDPRVMVQVASSAGAENDSRFAVYWAVLGIKALRISSKFVQGHEPKVLSADGCVVVGTKPMDYYLLVEHMEEVRIPSSVPPLTRDEFRAICDKHDNAEDIVHELENL